MVTYMEHSNFSEVSVMIKNIPRKFTTHNVLQELIRCVDRTSITMISVPWDRRNPCNLGFAFVNFIDKQFASHAWKSLDGQKWAFKCLPKVIQFQPARLLGLVSNLKHCSAALTPDAHPRHFPMILVDGRQVDFVTAAATLEQLQSEWGPEVPSTMLLQHLRGEKAQSAGSTTSSSPTLHSEGQLFRPCSETNSNSNLNSNPDPNPHQNPMDVNVLEQLLDWSKKAPQVAPRNPMEINQLEQLLQWSQGSRGAFGV